MSRRPGFDLRLDFRDDGSVDLATAASDLDTVCGRDNLAQALKMRLLVSRGELRRLGHPRYGTRVHELIGEPMDRPNLELLRRFVRQTLLSDPRVTRVARLAVQTLPAEPGAVAVQALVEHDLGQPLELGVILDVG